jgi:hypothetical protein
LALRKAAIEVVHVAFDDLIPVERQAAAATHSLGTFKRWREQIAAAVDFHIGLVKEGVPSNTTAGCITQLEERAGCDQLNPTPRETTSTNVDESHQLASAEVDEADGGDVSLERNEFLGRVSLDSTHSRILVVIDDNNYLRSMRYPYYQVSPPAREWLCSYTVSWKWVTPARWCNSSSGEQQSSQLNRLQRCNYVFPVSFINHIDKFD